jgi:RNA polymerase sigma-B factor
MISPATTTAPFGKHVLIDTDPATRIALESYASNRDPRLRDQLILRYERVVQWVVKREARQSAHVDDLMQVGRLALFHALERFDPARGVRFTSYAVKIISGNLKHYYRDHMAVIRVPRPLQELATRLPQIQEKLTQLLGRQPNDEELAVSAGVPVGEVCSAQKVQDAYRPQSINETLDDRSAAECAGATDGGINAIVEFAPLRSAIDRLGARHRFVVRRRYFDHWSQMRVAGALGISQMQVSRLEREGLRKLRLYLGSSPVDAHALAN